MESAILKATNFNAFFGDNHVLKNINLDIQKNNVWAIMGPSGCGKTTFIRCVNRMHELSPNARVEGSLQLNGEEIYDMNPVLLRRKVGMVFQHPNPFPTMSIYDNVIAGYILNGVKLSRFEKDEIVETSLKRAALWMEVRSTRALSMNPEILLLDEATSALDPISTAKIEELIHELKSEYTILMVTHNMQQAARVSDKTAFFYLGELIEADNTKTIFTNPKHEKTQDYIRGHFG